MADKIILKGIELSGRHGCSEAERKHAQPFVVDAELFLDLTWAAKSDDLGETIDYALVISDIKKVVEGTSHNLIETVAQDIADLLLRRYMLLSGIKITLHKVKPPIGNKIADAAVEIIRRRMK